jgi:hypothetical protein
MQTTHLALGKLDQPAKHVLEAHVLMHHGKWERCNYRSQQLGLCEKEAEKSGERAVYHRNLIR